MPPKITSLGPQKQLAALPWRQHGDRLEVLLITSRLSRRWLIPKGWPMKGKTDAQAAAREAYEEAGIKGVMSPEPVGGYEYAKDLPDGRSIPCQVDVFALRVERELGNWPERQDRERAWMGLSEAAAAIFEPGLSDFLGRLDPAGIAGSLDTRASKKRARSHGRIAG